MKNQFLVGLLFALPPLYAQKTASSTTPSWITTKVEFATTGGTPVNFPSMVIDQLPFCSSEGMCSAVFALNPAKGGESVVDSFDLSGHSHVIDPRTIEGMVNPGVLRIAPVEHGVAVLFHALTSDDNYAAQRDPLNLGAQPPKVKVKGDGDFLAIYNEDGTLRSCHRLDVRFHPTKIASLTSDQFLLLGFDQTNLLPVSASVDSSGEVTRFLDQEGSLPTAEKFKDLNERLLGKNRAVFSDDPEVQKAATLSAGLSALEFGYTGNRLLLLEPGTGADAEVWSISPGGDIKKLKLRMPQGLKADSILCSSDGSLIIRAFVSENAATLLEFDPDSGELRRKIDTQAVPATSIFYKKDETFYSVWWDKGRSFILKSK